MCSDLIEPENLSTRRSLETLKGGACIWMVFNQGGGIFNKPTSKVQMPGDYRKVGWGGWGEGMGEGEVEMSNWSAHDKISRFK